MAQLNSLTDVLDFLNGKSGGEPGAPGIAAALATITPDVWAPPPSGDITGATDSALVQPLENALSAAGGGVMRFHPGTYWGELTAMPHVVHVWPGRWTSTWKAPAGYVGTVIKGLNFDALTGKPKATGDYALGCPGTGFYGVTIDANNTAQRCLALWCAYFQFDDLRLINSAGDTGLWTEFTDVDNFADPNQQTDGVCGRVYISNSAGLGWIQRGPHDCRVDTLLCHNNTLGDLQVDAIANGYDGGLDCKYFNGFLQGSGATCVKVLNEAYFGMYSGQLTAPPDGVALDLGAQVGACVIIGQVAGAGVGMHLRGTNHQIHVRASNNPGSVCKIDGLSKSHVGIEGASVNGAIFNYVSENGPNTFVVTADIGTWEISGDLHSNTSVTNLAFLTNPVPPTGEIIAVSGANIPAGTTLTITGATTGTLSNAATATVAGETLTLTGALFSPAGAVTSITGLNQQTTAIISANGAAGSFSGTKLPGVSTGGIVKISLSNGWNPGFGQSSGQVLTSDTIVTTASIEAASATAGSGAAPPATVQGYIEFTDHNGVVRKIPYYDT